MKETVDKLLTEKQVSEIVGFKRAKLIKMIKADEFPKPKKFGKSTRWFARDIEQWQKEQKEKNNKKSLDNTTGDKASYEQGILEEVGKFLEDVL
tara:strand:- start:267 stop:548 length:282 start_codon:yes stop_codon:yes gene_type:complete